MITLSLFALTKKSPGIITLLIATGLLTLSILDTCHAIHTTTNTTTESSEAETMEKGMNFLFQMTKGFLEVIQPNKIYEKYDIHQFQNESYLKEVTRDWQKIVLYLIGFVICLAIGIVFIIVMPIVGFCMCCCRTCCNNCGGKKRKNDPRNARYKKRCYVSFLTLLNTFILFAVVCTFVTSEIYKKRFVDTPEFFNVAKGEVHNLIGFIDNSFQELKTIAEKQTSILESDLSVHLKKTANESVTALAKSINITSVMDKVQNLGNGVIALNSSISQLSHSLTKLVDLGSTLENQLDGVKRSVLVKLQSCVQTECQQVADFINRTSVNAQFSQLDKQTVLLSNLSSLLTIPNLAKEAENKLDGVSKNITDIIDKQNQTIEESFTKLKDEINSSMTVISKIKADIPIDLFDNQLDKVLNVYKSDKIYFSIPWYIGICVGSILLLIVVCNYLGILFGLCGERPGDNAPCCNKGVAANFLLAGVGFYFLFCWILILLVMLEFVFGGILYTELCKYLDKNDPSKLKPLLINLNYNYSVFDKTVQLNVYDAVDKCYKNYSVMNTISFPKIFLSDKIPTQALIDKIKNISRSDLSNIKVTLLDAELDNKLKMFENLATSTINISQYEIELNKTVVTTDLNVLAMNLTSLSSRVNISFTTNTENLKKIQDTTYIQMKNEMNNLGKILGAVKKNMNLDKEVSSLIQAIKNVQNSVNVNGTEIVTKIIGDQLEKLANIVLNFIDNLIDSIITKIAPCKPMYNIVYAFTDMVCITLLNPFNGFWFSTGWAVFFFIPTIIFAIKLAGLYRCLYRRDPSREIPDSYVVGDADNIPLARVNQGKSSPQGMPNNAYDEISSNKYHPPPNQPYNYGGPGNPYSGYPVYPPPSYHDKSKI